ncbi:mechanosensitive ion channel [bacterium]|nr:mechanosensitive ion channel [bacterium]MBU1637999.1 mechanosensitive ion channel [bacterium]MBU1921263.1 mechanosensitive ion channel [bacterium]
MNGANDYLVWAVEQIKYWSPKLVTAILVLLIGLWIIKAVVKVVNRLMDRRDVDISLRGFLKSLLSISLKILLLITVAGMLGVETTSFIALVGAAGLAIGLALQGSLANLAGGVLILIFKPYKVGDWIEAQGHSGSVHSIQIFNTVLKSVDNKTILIPNGPLAGGSIVNYSTEDLRRVDMKFGCSYSDDILKVQQVLQSLVDKDSRVLKEPAPAILLSELADSSVNFALRLWAKKEDYWDIYFDFHKNVKLEFDKSHISIPFPQHDVHIHQATSAA